MQGSRMIFAATFLAAFVSAASAATLLPLDPSVRAERVRYEKLHINERFGVPFRPFASACNDVKPGVANCTLKIVTDERGEPRAFHASAIAGFTPLQLAKAYNLPAVAGGLPIIAVVAAFGDPNVASDLKIYSRQFGLTLLPNCHGPVAQSGVPCLQAVNGNGGKKLPSGTSWAAVYALDAELAHGLCPNCSLLLVEAKSNAQKNLYKAVNTAAALGANTIALSWAVQEYKKEASDDAKYFTHPGVAIVATSGSGTYQSCTPFTTTLCFPASSPHVTAVGGTSLFLNEDGTYNSEIADIADSNGCAAYEPKPDWQPDLGGCSRRTTADVAFDADPNTGVAIFNSAGCNKGKDCWFEVGGTAVGAPAIAAVYALAGLVPGDTFGSEIPYESGNASNLHDITSGSDGTCDPSYLCTAEPGYDGPSGLGTPNGTGAFAAKATRR